jgi:hypothetical protein
MTDRPFPDEEYAPEAAGEPDEPEKKSGFTRYMVIGFGGLAAAIFGALVIAIVAAAANPEGEGVAGTFRMIRDFLIIILALQGLFISVALIVLILQLAALVNLLRNEITPVIDEMRDAAQTARGTAEFVSENVARPVIRTAATVAGVRAFFVELMGIRRNVSGRAGRNGRE